MTATHINRLAIVDGIYLNGEDTIKNNEDDEDSRECSSFPNSPTPENDRPSTITEVLIRYTNI